RVGLHVRARSPRRQRRPPDCGALGDERAGGIGHSIWPSHHPGQKFWHKQIWASIFCSQRRGQVRIIASIVRCTRPRRCFEVYLCRTCLVLFLRLSNFTPRFFVGCFVRRYFSLIVCRTRVVCQGFVRKEDTAAFTWAFDKYSDCCCNGGLCPPGVIFTGDPKTAAAAVKASMPSTKHLLCSWHLYKNLKEHTDKH
ncbi:unnamed protein product, partial [Phaeothamnion confervicola]